MADVDIRPSSIFDLHNIDRFNAAHSAPLNRPTVELKRYATLSKNRQYAKISLAIGLLERLLVFAVDIFAAYAVRLDDDPTFAANLSYFSQKNFAIFTFDLRHFLYHLARLNAV